jgi:hypothetical protein
LGEWIRQWRRTSQLGGKRYLVGMMSKLEKSIHEVLSRMTSQLVADERKVDSNAANLGQVWEKVDLVMITISSVQEEHVPVANQLRVIASVGM